MIWRTIKGLVREAFENSALTFDEHPILSPDKINLVTIVQLRIEPSYTDDQLQFGTRPYARAVTVNLRYIAAEEQMDAIEAALDAAYHTAGTLIQGLLGTDMRGVDRGPQDFIPHPEETGIILGTEIWTFGR